LSELPTGWVDATFDQLTEYISRGKSPKYSDHSVLPVVNQRAIRWFGIQDEHLKYVAEEQIPAWTEERYIREGDILWNSTGTGTIGRACLVQRRNLSPPKVVDSHVTIVRSESKVVDPRYLFAWIRGPKVQGAIEDLASGSTNQIELNRSTIQAMHVPVAPLTEQQRIAAKLDIVLAKVDACRDRLDRVPQILKRFREAVLEAAVSGRLTEEWRQHDKGPHKWGNRTVSDVAEVVRGASPRPAGDSRFFGGDVPWITVGELTKDENKYLTTVSTFLTLAGKERSRFVMPGTLLLSNSGATLGVPKIIKIGGCINDGSVALLGIEEPLKSYVYYVLKSKTQALRRLNQGAAQPNLNTTIVKAIEFKMPEAQEEQIEVVRRVEELFTLAAALQRRFEVALARVEELTPSVLAKAFRGELVPQDPNDEPAEEMLERIRAERSSKEAAARSHEERASRRLGDRTKTAAGRRLRASLA
jgi:type I restriction enzyme, S subunit